MKKLLLFLILIPFITTAQNNGYIQLIGWQKGDFIDKVDQPQNTCTYSIYSGNTLRKTFHFGPLNQTTDTTGNLFLQNHTGIEGNEYNLVIQAVAGSGVKFRCSYYIKCRIDDEQLFIQQGPWKKIR